MRKFFWGLLAMISLLGTARGQINTAQQKIRESQASVAAIESKAKKQADTIRWLMGGNVSANFTETWLTNWAAGGEPTITFSGNSSLFANYKRGKVYWENNAFMSYGIIKKDKHKAVKNDDQLKINSNLGYRMAKNWYYSFVFIGKTQFSPGYTSDTILISNFLAPATVNLSLGLDYKPSAGLSMHFSPLMGKATLVRSSNPTVLKTAGITDDLIAEGKKARYEFGGGIVVNMSGDFMSKRITYTTQLQLFSNYLEEPECVDVIWDFQFRILLAKHLSSTVRLNMIYDDNQKTIVKERNSNGAFVDVQHGAKLQVKEFFEIGFSYNF